MFTTALARRIFAATLAVFAGGAIGLVQPSAAQASGVGYIRLAHLVPDNIACDMYIQFQTPDGKVLKKLASIEYGTVSAYETMPAGAYAVTMRKPGSPETAPPVLSTAWVVKEGEAYTAARIGEPDNAEARVFKDDRTLPPGEKAKIRVVQAAQRMISASIVDGPSIASDTEFATVTGYTEVEPGNKTLRLQPAGGQPFTVPATLAPGTVYSVLVLQGKDGKLSAEVRVDASRVGRVPRGGVDTGVGGTAVSDGSPLPRLGVALLAATVLLVAIVLGALAARRSAARIPARNPARLPAVRR